jgi:thioesterase domain-containing protein/acyl carrier protein
MMDGMARVWRNVLDLPDIGPDDDFFRIGGHSLLAVRLIAEMEEASGVRLPVSAIFSAPTIRQMTTVVRNREGEHGFPGLVTLNAGAGRPPLYCIHGVPGTLFEFSRFAKNAGNDQPVYGIQAPGLDGNERPPGSVEEMAERCLGILRRNQPRGPYHLLSYCAGGAIAYEMACRLEAAGEKPGALCIIDYPAPHQEPENLFWSVTRYAGDNLDGALLHLHGFIHAGAEERVKSLRGLPRFILNKVRRLPAEVVKKPASPSRGLAAPDNVPGPAGACIAAAGEGRSPDGAGYPDWIRTSPEPQRTVALKIFNAIAAYRPGKYHGRVVLFLSGETARYCLRDGSFPGGYGWRKLTTGEVDIRGMEGNHHSIVLDGRVEQVVRTIRDRIDRASAEGEGHER